MCNHFRAGHTKGTAILEFLIIRTKLYSKP